MSVDPPMPSGPAAHTGPWRPAHLAILALVVCAVGLIGLQLGAGALDDGELALPDPCTRTVPISGDGADAQTQRIALGAVDHTACQLDTTREELLLVVIEAVDGDRDLPDGAEDHLRDGLIAQIDAEEQADRMGGITATVARQAVRFTPTSWILRAIREVRPLFD